MGFIQKVTQFFSSAPAPAADTGPVEAPKSVLEQVRAEHLRCIERQRGLRRQIQDLTWKPGSQAEISRIRSERDEAGKRKRGRKALKTFRRPETGPERYDLWNEKRGGKDEARLYHVLYGMIRGRSYAQIERNPKEPISSESLWTVLTSYAEVAEDHDTLVQIGEWVLGERPSMRKVV